MEKLLEGFMNEQDITFGQYFENYRKEKLSKRIDFYEIRDAKREIYENYPEVRELFEDNKAKGYSDGEIKAINEILSLESLQSKLETKEAFKLGFKEAYIFFKEQDMLNV